MPLEKQVCSRDLAERLRNLGVKQESLYEWVGLAYSDGVRWKLFEKYNGDSNYGIYSAFIVAELGELLPKYIDEGHSSLRIGPLGKKWRVGYAPYSDKVVVHFEKDDTEADARAKMLIYLILSR